MKKTGTVESFNVSPRGFHEGFLLRSGRKKVQINLEEGMEGIQPGEEITVEVEPEKPHGEPAHGVFRFLRLLSVNGELTRLDKVDAPFTGTIARLNYALHGAVNGAVLISGDFLHLKPEGAQAVKLKVAMKVAGRGDTRPMVGGHLVIEAGEVNGIAMPRRKARKKR